jgi:hypothetical protein
MTRLLILSCLFFLLIQNKEIRAQRSFSADTLENTIIYSNEKSGVVLAHSNGLGLGYRAGLNKTVFNTRIFAFEFVSLHSNKQIKIINPYYANSKRYVYGKLNDVFVLRAGISNKYLLNRKPYWGGVELRWLWEAGASIAFEKPYYLFVIKINQSPQGGLGYTIATERFNSDVSWDDIYGRAPFTKGLNEIKVVPGAYAKFGFNFEFGNVKTSTKSFEAGAVTEFFPQGLRMLDDDRNKRLFVNFYISYAFGKRFNKY